MSTKRGDSVLAAHDANLEDPESNGSDSHATPPCRTLRPLLQPSISRCAYCKRDRKKCDRESDDQKCQRCKHYSYPCFGEIEPTVPRREYNKNKCEYCREAKQKCMPMGRFGGKCNRCIEKGLPCSEPKPRKHNQTEPRTTISTQLPESANFPEPRSPLLRSEPVDVPVHPRLGAPSLSLPKTDDEEDEPLEYQNKPKRRAGFVVPEKRKRKYEDETIRPMKLIPALKNVYRHRPLAPGEDIRILVIEPGRSSDLLRCKFVPSALPSISGVLDPQRVIKYEALSYRWGQDSPEFAINVTYYDNKSYTTNAPLPISSMADALGKTFFIRSNLHAALLQLRDPREEVRLWVDALCIDQDNIEEKVLQFSRMQEIFIDAENLCIWLGEGHRNLATAGKDLEKARQTFDFIREMLSLQKFDVLVSDNIYADRWQSFVDLMNNPLFSRRWVVQEVAFAKEATVHYGPEVLQWSDFADAVALFMMQHDRIRELLKRNLTTDLDLVGNMSALGANTLVEATSNLFRRSENGKILERLMPLEILVSTFNTFEVSDPRDAIYSMLSIAIDTPYSNTRSAAQTELSTAEMPPPNDIRVLPNYSKSLVRTFTDFVDYCIEKSDSLDIICRHWAPVSKALLPTWVSLVTRSAFGGPENVLQGRCNADSLAGIPSRTNHKNYNASGSLKPSYTIIGPNSFRDISLEPAFPNSHFSSKSPDGDHEVASLIHHSGILYVKGIFVDTIGRLSPRAMQGMILQECLEVGGWNDDESERVPDSLWRTLVADRGPDGSSAPRWYARACLECFAHVTSNGDLDTGALIENPNTSSTMVSFLKRVQQVVWNRKFLRSKGRDVEETDRQLLGLAPTSALEGDVICILFGCSVPVILRETGPPEDRYYHLIGEAYVHGMMDGEALLREMPKYPYLDYSNFEIR